MEVYRHNRKNCYSVRLNKKVVAHVRAIRLENVEFVVSEAGRQRVLRTGQKNVHAFMRGDVVLQLPIPKFWSRVSYNPFKGPYFTTSYGSMELKFASHACAWADDKYHAVLINA